MTKFKLFAAITLVMSLTAEVGAQDFPSCPVLEKDDLTVTQIGRNYLEFTDIAKDGFMTADSQGNIWLASTSKTGSAAPQDTILQYKKESGFVASYPV